MLNIFFVCRRRLSLFSTPDFGELQLKFKLKRFYKNIISLLKAWFNVIQLNIVKCESL